MREIDKRTPISRRGFMRGAASAAPIAALAASGATIALDGAWAADAKALQPHTLKTMARMARDIFPHDRLADLYYVAAILPWDGKAAGDAAVKSLLEGGVARLDGDAKDRHGQSYLGVPWEADRVVLLQGIERTDFFKKIRSDLVVSLYNQKDLWRKFGYEGSSAEHGGYLTRGFNDIDWLPQS